MKNEEQREVFMRMRIILVVFILIVIFASGCISSVNVNKIDVSIENVNPSEILPLINSNDDITLFNIGAEVMENSGFIKKEEQNYGYYAVTVNSTNTMAPNFFICGFVNGITLFIPSLIGFPTDLQEFNLTAYLYIFNCEGTLIKIYRNSETFKKIAGLYYGQDPNKKASHFYTMLFSGILEQADSQKDEINFLLKNAGPVTNANMLAARTKITDFFKLNTSRR